MSQVFYILASVKNSMQILTLSKHPVRHKDYSEAIKEAKRLLGSHYDMTEVFIFKQIASVKKLEPMLEVTELDTQSDETLNEEPLVDTLQEILSEEEKEEQPSDKAKEFEALEPVRPYKSPKMERGPQDTQSLSNLEPGDEFYYKCAHYRLVAFRYPHETRVFNLFSEEIETLSSCIYVKKI